MIIQEHKTRPAISAMRSWGSSDCGKKRKNLYNSLDNVLVYVWNKNMASFEHTIFGILNSIFSRLVTSASKCLTFLFRFDSFSTGNVFLVSHSSQAINLWYIRNLMIGKNADRIYKMITFT
jgi:hypothetical protein